MNFANPQVIWIAVIAIAVLVIIGLIAFGARRRRSAELRDHFGREYDRTLEAAGSRARAEDALIARAEEVKQFDIRPLTAAERERYTGEWRRIEQRFVERPTTSVVEADELITDVMRTRGYPVSDFDKHAELLSVKHPKVVEHYRAGHDIIDRHGKESASTEDLRQAMQHYRELFRELLEPAADEPTAGDRDDDIVAEAELDADRPRETTRP
jgi:hypothetical protein